MRVHRYHSMGRAFLFVTLLSVYATTAAYGQASYAAQVRGVVKDQSGAMVPRATITITNDATGISTTAHSDDHGLYVLTGLRPAVYTIRAEGTGFRATEQKNVVLQVDQQQQWHRGVCIPVETYFHRKPALQGDLENALFLIRNEVLCPRTSQDAQEGHVCDFLGVPEEELRPLAKALGTTRALTAKERTAIAKEAAKAPLALLKDTDSFGVVAFDYNFYWPVKFQAVSNRDSITQSISTIIAGGETNIYPALREAFIQLAELKV